MKKAKYLGSTYSNLRMDPKFDQFWREVLNTRTEITESTFKKVCDVNCALVELGGLGVEGLKWGKYKCSCMLCGKPVFYFKSANGVYFYMTGGTAYIWKMEV